MKFAVVSDIHGNYPALVQVVEDAKRQGADRFVFLGDYIFDLPFSDQVIQYISQIENAAAVSGNKEIYLKKMAGENQSGWIFDQMGVIYQSYRELSEKSFAFLSALPKDAYIPLESGELIYASHYPEDMLQLMETDCSSLEFYRRMKEEPFSHEQFLNSFQELLKQNACRTIFDKINAKVVLFGHNHLQCFGYCGEKLIVNPGSCGQPLDSDNRAAYTIVEETASGFQVLERRVAYDIEETIRLAKKSKVYERGRIWSELVFLAMRTGLDYSGVIFEIASRIAASKNETGNPFANETWKQAYHLFISTEYGTKDAGF